MLDSDTKRINAKGLCGSLLNWKASQDLPQIVQPVTTRPSQLKNEITPLLEECDDLLGGPGEIKGCEVQLRIDENVPQLGITTTYSTIPCA